MKTQTDIQNELNLDLSEFTGTEQYYRHLSGKLFTDGAKYLADNYGCYWLLDEILYSNHPNEIAEFQVWKLTRMKDDAFKLTCEDGNYNVLREKAIPFSDFAANTVELWFANGVCYLPSEH